jgi:hypothetical protein
LLRQLMLRAFSFAEERAGKSIAARIEIMAMTTSSSMRVNARKVDPTTSLRGFGNFGEADGPDSLNNSWSSWIFILRTTAYFSRLSV